MQTQPPPHNKHIRFYVVIVTLVLGGVFFLLLMNEDNLLTGASTALFENKSEDQQVEEQSIAEEKPLGRETTVMVSSDQVPQVIKEAKIKVLETHFTNNNAKIKVNNDQLELNNVQEVTLKLADFEGEVEFDGDGLSLQGEAKRMEVNGIALAAKTDLQLSLGKVPFHYLYVDEIQLKNVIFPAGNGQVSVADKLTYTLEQEELGLFSFNGKIVVDSTASELTTLEGVSRGVKVSGALLNLDIR